MEKIIAYATNKDGKGYVVKIGEFDDIGDVVIRVSHFAQDVMITFELDTENQDDTA